MMKIGFDAKRYYHNNTGLGNYSRTLVGNLQKMFPDNEYVLYDEKTWSRTFNLGHLAAHDNCDVFHGLSNELPMDIPSGSRMVSVLTVHDVAWLTFPGMYHFLDRKIYDFKYGSSCHKADRIVAISESTKQDIMRFYDVPEDKIEVIYQPVAQNYYTPLQESEAIEILTPLDTPHSTFHVSHSDYILYVGSINSRKNLLSLVRALELLPEDIRPRLMVVGDGHEYRKEVETYIAEHHLEQDVRIETSIHDNNMLQALYRQAKVFVYPSFYEGFGLPVVEAALQHTPVITTTVSSLPEAAGPDACLIDPHADDAPEQIAHYVEHLLTDTTLADSIAERQEQYARQMFDPASLTRRMMSLYQSVVRL